jgi:hypothetical protein
MVFLSAVAAIGNVAILLALIFIYLRMFRETKASFAAGLIFFAIAILVQNMIFLYAYAMVTVSPQLSPIMLGVCATEFIGLLALLKQTL